MGRGRTREVRKYRVRKNMFRRFIRADILAALLTQKIRSMAEHLQVNKKDNSNRRSLRTLVHQRQQILRYFARKEPEKYEQLLTDLGLERRGVEGEITV